MIKYLQLAFTFDVPGMQEELSRLSARQWPLHYQSRHFEGEWSSLALRSIDGRADNSLISPLDDAPYFDTELLQSSPRMREALGRFQCPLLAVRLLRLTPGSVIREHTDGGLNFEQGLIRIHIPVITNPGVEFLLQGEMLSMREGECWYCNFNLPHALANRGETDRVHLVIDAVVNDWVKELFAGPLVLQRKLIDDPSEKPDEQTRKEMIFHLRQLNTPVSNKLADELEAQRNN